MIFTERKKMQTSLLEIIFKICEGIVIQLEHCVTKLRKKKLGTKFTVVINKETHTEKFHVAMLIIANT